MTGSRPMDRVRRPEYTGANRCLPCTATNVAIAVVLSVGVAYGWATLVGPLWWVTAGTLLAASLGAIWLRGYLVPGTPRLTQRYFPDWLLARFEKAPPGAPGAADDVEYGPPGEPSPNGGAATAAGETSRASSGRTADSAETPGHAGDREDVDPEVVLLDAGVVEPCEHEDDLCLVGGFRDGWRERMRAIREAGTERDELARELDLDPDTIEFEEYGGAFVADSDRGRVGQWESRAALVADLAAARELPGWVDGWEDLPVASRSRLLGGLRIFLEHCPACGGPVAPGTETVESCCRSRDVVAATCEDCDARLLEVSHPGDGG